MSGWTANDVREWRRRLKWTQQKAAEELRYHKEAYKKLECGTRKVQPHVRRLLELAERNHLRSLHSTSTEGGSLQGFATAEAVAAYHDALERDGKLVVAGGRRRLRHVALFAGIGGAAAGFERAGSDAILLASSDISLGSNALHRFRWPDAPRLGDVERVDWARLRGMVDLVTFGPPCQSFSQAGKRRGLDDPRGCLIMHSLRAIRAMQPKWMVFENVEGFLSFRQALDEFETAAAELGYKLAKRVLDARAFGLPQSRPRLWIVGERGPDARGPDAVLDLRESPCRIKIARAAGWSDPPRRFEGGSGDLIMAPEPDWLDTASWAAPGPFPLPAAESRPIPAPGSVLATSYRNYQVKEVAPCVQTRTNSLNSVPIILERQADGTWRDRRSTPTECLRLQGYDDDWLDGPKLRGEAFSDAQRGQLIGNAWPVTMAAWVLAGVEAAMGAERPAIAVDYRRMFRPFGGPPQPFAALASAAANCDGIPLAIPAAAGRRSSGAIADMMRAPERRGALLA